MHEFASLFFILNEKEVINFFYLSFISFDFL